MDGFATIAAAHAHLDGLGHEREGYEARIRALAAGRKDPGGLDKSALTERIKEVETEIKGMEKKLGRKLGESSSSDRVEVDVPEPANA